MKRFLILPLLVMASIFLSASPVQGYANTPPIDPSYNTRIIDDSLFLNAGSMSAQDIQNFLNNKVPVCDTNHQGGLTPPPYICLKDYVDPAVGKKASQIIYEEAVAVGLNPQVILVTLQKEQSLVTDTWPYPSQYRSAMGYGCLESQTVCDSQYYGFYNQVRLGARLLRAAAARSCGDTATLPNWSINSKWTRGNTVTIDGRSTNIGSCATGSLYNYTPHRPDSAYTPVNGVYYYGNYNFINFYLSWFGSTTVAPIAGNVHRLYNPRTGNFISTSNSTEILAALGREGFISEGVGFISPRPDEDYAVPVYRLSRNGRYLFTTNETEKNQAIMQYGYRFEGAGFSGYSAQVTNTYPIWRLSNPQGVYFYTISVAERDQAWASRGFKLDGIAFYAASTSSPTAVHRLTKNGRHLYTTSTIEKDMALANYGYTYEGAGFTASTGIAPDLLPVYRVTRAGVYFYTTNAGEKNSAVIHSGYVSESTGFYSKPSWAAGTSPVFRLTNPRTSDYLYTLNPAERDDALSRYGYSYQGNEFAQ